MLCVSVCCVAEEKLSVCSSQSRCKARCQLRIVSFELRLMFCGVIKLSALCSLFIRYWLIYPSSEERSSRGSGMSMVVTLHGCTGSEKLFGKTLNQHKNKWFHQVKSKFDPPPVSLSFWKCNLKESRFTSFIDGWFCSVSLEMIWLLFVSCVFRKELVGGAKVQQTGRGRSREVSSFHPSHYLWLALLLMVSRLIFVRWLIYVNNKPKVRQTFMLSL